MGDAKNPERAGQAAQAAYAAGRAAAFNTTLLTVFLLAVGLAVVWLAQSSLNIKGDSVYVTLLLVPVLVYLLVTGQLGELKLPGVTLTAMKNEIAGVRRDVTDVGELEPERSTYLGKLRQVQAKDGTNFCLIYADVVGLRAYTRELYLKQEEPRRRMEKAIRDDVIRSLGIALTDAFYGLIPVGEFKGAKHDLFFLEEPDVAMIVRRIPAGKAREIAEQGRKRFAAGCNCQAKVVVQVVSAGKSPRELDAEAAERLAQSPD